MRLLLSILLLSVRAWGQPFGSFADLNSLAGGSVAVATTPTNLPGGLSAAGWWEPSRSGGYITNGSVGTLVNLTSIGAGFNLTNISASPVPPLRQVAALNGLDTLFFRDDANTLLVSLNYTSPQPHEVIMVMALTNAASSVFPFGGVNGGAVYHRFEHNSAGNKRFMLGAGGVGDATVCVDITNAWVAVDCVWSNASSTIFTNNIQGLVVNMNASLAGGISLGGHNGGSKPRFALASMISFTNMVLTATQRSNVWWYVTNRFGVSGAFGIP